MKDNDNQQKQSYLIASLEKGLLILEMLSRHKEPLSLGELASLAGMGPSTATRYAATLMHLGYVRRDPGTKQFRLTPKVLSLGFALLRDMDLRTRVASHLLDAAQQLNVGAQCAILDGTEIVYIERIRMNTLIDLDIPVGSRLPAYCTALGKAVLAFMDQASVEKIINETNMIAYTPYTETNKAGFLRTLDDTRRRGFAINRQELILGRDAVAAPIFRNGKVEGSIGFSFPFDENHKDTFEAKLAQVLIDISKKVSLD
ncbi:MAG: IclR family transcriptional regulator [Proteobacteria bacterium]|nr:IclR family transcriptional regulator [Pseudomonadota bacterium]